MQFESGSGWRKFFVAIHLCDFRFCMPRVRLSRQKSLPVEQFFLHTMRKISLNWLEHFFNEIIKEIYGSSAFLTLAFYHTNVLFWKIKVFMSLYKRNFRYMVFTYTTRRIRMKFITYKLFFPRASIKSH